jgi:HK97 family phage major capsid protein
MSKAVQTLDELNATLAAQDRQIGQLHAAFKSGVSFQPRADLTAEGNLIKGIMAGRKDMIVEAGGRPYVSDAADKMVAGTPGAKVLYSDASTGSYAVPQEMHAEVVRVIGELSVMYNKVKRIPMSSYQKVVPVKNATAALTWVTGQSVATTEMLPTFDQKTLTAFAVAGYVTLHESFLEDAAPDVASYFNQIISEDFSDEIDNQVLCGTGVPWTGVLNTVGTNVVTASGPQFSNICFNDLMAMVGALTKQSYRRNAAFFFNPTVIDSLRSEKDASGRPLIVDPAAPAPSRLVGYPVFAVDAMPSTSAINTKFGCFFDPQTFLLGERKMLELELFSGTSGRVTNSLIYLRAWARYGGVLAIPAAVAVIKTST